MRVNPDGRLPPVILQLIGEVPPVAFSFVEYRDLTWASGSRVEVVITSGALILITSAWVELAE